MHSPSRSARLAAGLSSADAAARLGVSVKYLLAVERGEAAPSEYFARRASRLYGCDMHVFRRPVRSISTSRRSSAAATATRRQAARARKGAP